LWLNDTYPATAARAKAEAAIIICWGDEMVMAEDAHWLRSYVPVG
jgi:hypothetical protein